MLPHRLVREAQWKGSYKKRVGVHNRSQRWRLRKDLCPECTAWHIAEEGKSPTLPVSFIGQEEKRLVARYGSAQRSAELIQAKRRLRRSRHPHRLLRVKDTVAQKLERVSVPLIRAR